MKNRFISLLKSTGRDGVDNVIGGLEKLGFFTAPASTRFHLSHEGGLLEHSLNVCNMAIMVRNEMVAYDPSLESSLPLESVILVSLLHDVCKAEVYVPVQKWRKDASNQWEQYTTYEPDYSHFPMGHGEKSVIRLMGMGLRLTVDEMLAIRWHMSAWDLPFQSHEEMSNLNAAKEKSPLLTILQCADMLASGIIETSKQQQGNA